MPPQRCWPRGGRGRVRRRVGLHVVRRGGTGMSRSAPRESSDVPERRTKGTGTCLQGEQKESEVRDEWEDNNR